MEQHVSRFRPGGPGRGLLPHRHPVDEIAKIEKDHEFRFLGALAKLKAKNKAAAPAPVKPAESKMISVAGYRCQFCGATYEKAPDVCHVCQAIGSFEPTTIQKKVEG